MFWLKMALKSSVLIVIFGNIIGQVKPNSLESLILTALMIGAVAWVIHYDLKRRPTSGTD